MTHQQDEDDGPDEAKDEVIIGPEPTVFARPVAGGVDRGGDADDASGKAVAEQVVQADAGALALKHLDEEDVDLEALEEHPHEGGEEEVVEESGDDAAEGTVRRRLDAKEEEELSDEEAEAEVLVDRRAVALENQNIKFSSSILTGKRNGFSCFRI
jgi:hypothetical protein